MLDYQLPEVGDRENLAVKVSMGQMPKFMSVRGDQVRIAPVKDLGSYNIMVELEDAGKARKEYVIMVTVYEEVSGDGVGY